jgi:hypothetical protein
MCAILDRACLAFTERFYSALFQGRTVQAAFEAAEICLKTHFPSESGKFILLPAKGVDHNVLLNIGVSQEGSSSSVMFQDISPPMPIHNLPRDSDSCLVGQEECLINIYNLLHRPCHNAEASRLIAVTGEKGIGKSRVRRKKIQIQV